MSEFKPFSPYLSPTEQKILLGNAVTYPFSDLKSVMGGALGGIAGHRAVAHPAVAQYASKIFKTPESAGIGAAVGGSILGMMASRMLRPGKPIGIKPDAGLAPQEELSA